MLGYVHCGQILRGLTFFEQAGYFTSVVLLIDLERGRKIAD